jgi:hypothetical protein
MGFDLPCNDDIGCKYDKMDIFYWIGFKKLRYSLFLWYINRLT